MVDFKKNAHPSNRKPAHTRRATAPHDAMAPATTQQHTTTTPTAYAPATPTSTVAMQPRVCRLNEALDAKRQSSGNEYRFTPERDQWDGKYWFGGPVGAVAIMVFSHVLVYYLWICIDFYGGSFIHPWSSQLNGEAFGSAIARILLTHASPTIPAMLAYVGLVSFEYLLAVVLPGPIALGLPVPSENGFVHRYKCNGVYSWYIILAGLATLHLTGICPLSTLRENYGHFLTAAVICADTLSIWLYFYGIVAGRAVRMSGNFVYDFFMGSILNPKLPGNVDMKLFAEIRNSWVLLFVNAISSAAVMYQETGSLTPNMIVLLIAYFLYANACQKGEECITTTWDIHYEKFGWMLIFWNFAGVPFTYCLQAFYLAKCAPTLSYSPIVAAGMLAVLFTAYFCWDTTNAQKNRFRMERIGVPPALLHRRTFPQLPWGFIENPRVVTGAEGTLFADGWYRYARKFHYTADVVMALIWSSTCGAAAPAPWFYPAFFVPMLIDRDLRDEHRCAHKYGAVWDEYLRQVPYRFIPGVF